MFQNLFKRIYSKEEKILFDFLKQNRLFANLKKNEMHAFTQSMYLRRYKKNEVVFFRNDPSQALYLIKTGRIALQLDVADKFETFAYIKPYASFGNNALMDKTRRLYNAVVKSDAAELYVIPQVNIQTVFKSKPRVKAKIMTSLSEVYHENTANLFSSYRSTFGFFDLKQVHHNLEYGE